MPSVTPLLRTLRGGSGILVGDRSIGSPVAHYLGTSTRIFSRTTMRNLILSLCFICPTASEGADEPELPNVETTYTTISSEGYVGRRMQDIIPPQAVKRIALTEVRGPRNLQSRPDHDAIMKELFASDRKSVEWGASCDGIGQQEIYHRDRWGTFLPGALRRLGW